MSFSWAKLGPLGFGLWVFWNRVGASQTTTQGSNAALERTGGLVYIVALALSLAFAAALLPRLALLQERKLFLLGIPSLAMLGSTVRTLAELGPTINAFWLMFGAVVMGIGSAGLVIMWGESYSSLGMKRASLYTAASFVAASGLSILRSVSPVEVADVIFIMAPIFSGLLMWLGMKERYREAEPFDAKTLRRFRLPWRYACAIVIYSAIFGLVRNLENAPPTVFDRVAVVAAALLVVFGALSSSRVRNLSYTYRPVLPLMAAGLLLLPFLEKLDFFLIRPIVGTGFACFDMLLWIVLADIVSRFKIPAVRVFGLGRFCLQSGIVIGLLLSGTVRAVGAHELGLVALAAGMTLLLVLTSTLLMNERDVIATWGLADVPPVQSESELRERQILAVSKKYALSPREQEVLLLLSQGKDVAEIQRALFIANTTAKVHVRHIYQKIGVHKRKDLLALLGEHAKDPNYAAEVH